MRDKIISPGRTPVIFDWYHNDCESGLRSVYRAERFEPGKLSKVVDDLRDSPHFRDLLGAYSAAADEEKETDEKMARPRDLLESEAFMGLLARVYAAGSMQDCHVFNENAE